MRHLHPDRPATRRELRAFAWTVGLAFALVAALLLWRGRLTIAIVPGALGLLLLAAGVLIPARLGPVHRAWMGLAVALSRVTTPVFMAVVYFGIFTPLGLVRRLVGRGRLGVPREAATGWVRRPPGGRRGDLTRQF